MLAVGQSEEVVGRAQRESKAAATVYVLSWSVGTQMLVLTFIICTHADIYSLTHELIKNQN